ncbi:MAG: asparagine synthase-related protein [Coriobacteriia bacterium]|nr:asparagine synthase-related protein [Coriobacteriia bacterium]
MSPSPAPPSPFEIVTAFSGGVDSSTVATIAHRALGHRALAVFFDTPLIDDEDRAWAAQVAHDGGFALEVIELNPLTIDEVRFNDPLRCYYCKHALFSELKRRYPDARICDGTNADDDPARRPGMRALAELGVCSPLRCCGIGKEEVRSMARRLGLANATRPSRPCRAVSLPHGTDLAEALVVDYSKREARRQAELRNRSQCDIASR